jgi:hypothetical protein
MHVERSYLVAMQFWELLPYRRMELYVELLIGKHQQWGWLMAPKLMSDLLVSIAGKEDDDHIDPH